MPPMHILRTQQFDKDWLDGFFWKVTKLKREFSTNPGRLELRSSLQGRLCFSVFFEPSTRTRFSFESAAHHLGMGVVASENAGEFSSIVKGELPEHMLRVLCGYRPDVIVWRHKATGIAERIAPIASECGVPLINAGDGTGQHPTQALLDVYTIVEHFGSAENLTVVIGGDLRYGRTVKSLTYLLAKFVGVRFVFISPRELAMDEGVLTHLRTHRVPFEEASVSSAFELNRALNRADVVYWTRVQNERMGDELKASVASASRQYRITLEQAGSLKSNAILLHPMPINGEIESAVDTHPCAKYFRQADNGLFVRMALFQKMLGF